MSQKHYTHLSQEERIIVQNRLDNGEDYKDIAKAIGRCKETVWRELRRNGTLPNVSTTRVNKPVADARHCRGTEESEKIKQRKRRYGQRKKHFAACSQIRYNASKAHERALSRVKTQTPFLERLEYEETLSFMIITLDSGWSPEQIAGRIKLEGIYPYVSATAMRNYIKRHPELGLEDDLPRKGKKYRKQKATEYNHTDHRRTIDERPAEVGELKRIGDLEGDTIVGKDPRDRILVHEDRKSGLVSMGRIIGFSADKIQKQAVRDIIRVFGALMIETITYDNGVEFTFWKLLEQILNKLGAELKELDTESEKRPIIYFAHAYHSWERGRNENVNGLIRRYLPKGTDFKKITDDDILRIEFMLNNRPRKRLGWLTPAECYSANVALEG